MRLTDLGTSEQSGKLHCTKLNYPEVKPMQTRVLDISNQSSQSLDVSAQFHTQT